MRQILLIAMGLMSAACEGGTAPNDDPALQSGQAPIGDFRRNMPSGLSVISDYGFDDALPPHQDGVQWEADLGSSGWRALDWGKTGGGVQRTADPASPVSPGYVLEEIYPAHLSGSGPASVWNRFSQVNTLYVSWMVKWDSNFHHNTNSEKLLFFNSGSGQYIFHYHWNNEAIQGITQASDGGNQLEANQMPPDSFGHPMARPIDGQWVEFELLFERSTGTVKWWTNGVLRAVHTGRSFNPLWEVKISSTWGGGGDKQGTHSRYNDHIFLAGAN